MLELSMLFFESLEEDFTVILDVVKVFLPDITEYVPDPPCALPAVETRSSSPTGRAFIFRALSLRSRLFCVPRVELSSSGSPLIWIHQLASFPAVADMDAGIDQRISS